MGMILRSSKHDNYVLKIEFGVANLEINGETISNPLKQPYLCIEVLPPTKGRVNSGYSVTGLIFGFAKAKFKPRVSTQKLLKVLSDLGFFLTSNTLRDGMTKTDSSQNKKNKKKKDKESHIDVA